MERRVKILSKEEEYDLFEKLQSLKEEKKLIKLRIKNSIETKIDEFENNIKFNFEEMNNKNAMEQMIDVRKEMFDLKDKILFIEKEIRSIKEKVILSTEGLVKMMAKKYGYFFSDATQEGYMGVLRAIDKFDHKRGIKFFSYAEYWVRQFINRALKKDRIIQFPQYVNGLLNNYYKFKKKFISLEQREPTSEEMAEGLKIPFAKIREIKRALKIIEILSLEEYVKEENLTDDENIEDIIHEDEELTLSDTIADTKNLSPFDCVAEKILQERITNILHTLTSKQEKVMKERFFKDRELEDVGNDFGLTRQRIKQIESKAIKKLRYSNRSKILKNFNEE